MVVLSLIGALVGAGFASGQEIYLFFYKYSLYGILGLILCSTLIGFIIYKCLIITFKNDINSYKGFLDFIFARNKKISDIMNIIVNMFLLISFFIMISGFGAYFEQEFNMNKFIGSGILAIICFILFLKDMKGVAKANSVVVPVLIFFIVFVGIKNAINIDFSDIGTNIVLRQNIFKNWFLQGIIYASYNIILLLPVIVNLKPYVKSEKSVINIALLAGIIAFFLALCIYLLLVNVKVPFSTVQMPAVYAISNMSKTLKGMYGVIILFSIFTTAISIGMSFLENIVKNKKNFPQFAGIMCITGILISNFGFSNLVNLLFPIFGYLGLLQIYYIVKG